MSNNFKKERTADSPIYLKDNSYLKPKEMFKFIERLSFKKKKKKFLSLDVGCAGGNFLHFLKKKNPQSEFCGMDPISDLVKKAKNYVPNCRFYKKSVLNPKSWQSKIYDKVFMVGVHPIFDDFTIPLKNIISWTKPKGEIYICDMFNPFPVDVFIYYRMSKDIKKNKLESGWNNFSIESFSNFLKKDKRVKSFSFTKFDIPFDLKRQKDPVRSWTIKEKNKKRLMINGLGLIQNQCLLKITLN
jgi:SAM-dependent methyltransferase